MREGIKNRFRSRTSKQHANKANGVLLEVCFNQSLVSERMTPKYGTIESRNSESVS